MLLKFFQIRKNSASVFLLNLTCEYRLGPLILSSDLLSSSLLLISDALSSWRRCSETPNLSLALRRIISVILNTALDRCPVKGKIKSVFVIYIFVINLLRIARVTRKHLDPPNNHLKTMLNFTKTCECTLLNYNMAQLVRVAKTT